VGDGTSNNPIHIGHWKAWTPTITASSGTPTTVTLSESSYAQIGKTVHLRIRLAVVDKGTASVTLRFTLTVTGASDFSIGMGYEYIAVGYVVILQCSTSLVNVSNASTASPWVNTHAFKMFLTYEAA
jgi:hypothetical protein